MIMITTTSIYEDYTTPGVGLTTMYSLTMWTWATLLQVLLMFWVLKNMLH